MAKIIDGKKIAQKILDHIKINIEHLKKQGKQIKLAVVFVGKNRPSKIYIKRKKEAAKYVGVDFALYSYPKNIKKVELIKKIKKIQQDKALTGIIVQLPLPERFYVPEVLNAIQSKYDVDCLTDINIGKLVMKTNKIIPPTPGAVCTILDELNINVAGKNVTIVGAGALVGKPLSIMLLNKGATVITCNSQTRDIKKKCLQADILVSAVGKRGLITASMVKKGATVIDTGIVFENKKMFGDVIFEPVAKKADYITPTPGGVGPITVALLLQNLVTCHKKQ